MKVGASASVNAVAYVRMNGVKEPYFRIKIFSFEKNILL